MVVRWDELAAEAAKAEVAREGEAPEETEALQKGEALQVDWPHWKHQRARSLPLASTV